MIVIQRKIPIIKSLGKRELIGYTIATQTSPEPQNVSKPTKEITNVSKYVLCMMSIFKDINR